MRSFLTTLLIGSLVSASGIVNTATAAPYGSYAEVPGKSVLSGKVTDASGKPLAGAAVFLHEAKAGVVTKDDGTFTSPAVPAGKYLVEVSFTGYATQILTIDLSTNAVRNFSLTETVVEQEAVIVTGVASAIRLKESAQPVSVVKRSDLLQSSSTNIIDALSKAVPGVSGLSTGPAIAKPVIRGLGYNRVVTVHDGVRQEGQQWGDEHGIEIDEYSVQKVEVLKGPASLMYGSDAMAGVVHIITNVPVERGTIKGNILGSFTDNNGLWGTNANVAGHLNNGFNWNAYGTYRSAGDYQNKYDGRVFNSRFNERNFGGYVGINKSWGYSHLLVSNFNQQIGMVEGARDAATGQFLIFPETPDERIATNDELKSRSIYTPYQRINHFKIASDNNFAIGNNRLMVNIGYQENKRREFGDPDAPGTPDLFFDLKTVNYSVQFQLHENNGWKTAFGVTGMYQQNRNLAEEVLIPEYNQFDAGAFIYTKKTFNSKLTLSGGVRGDIRSLNSKAFDDNGSPKFSAFKKNFGNFSGSAGLSYNTSKDVTLKLNIARGYRAPSVSELASNGAHEGTNRYEYGDNNLKTETSFQVDAGVEVNTMHVSFSLNAFYNNISNYIYYSRLEAVGGGDSLVDLGGGDFAEAFKFRQAGASLAGFEVNVDLHPHPLDWLHFENSFSMVAGTFNQTFEGTNKLPFIPAPRWQSELRGNFKKAGSTLRNAYLKFALDYTASQKNVFSAYNTETPTGSYALLNIGAGTDVVSRGKTIFGIHLSLNNLTDVAYQNHLSRLKYTDVNNVTGRTGVFNMGRSFNVKINVPLDFRLK
ncbi:TonB-dependent receptor [Sediminibacterium ginsengisoli]|uniref:Iron complex outermembrane recepter protein n=1 Tax=Sediminibacterium ginsengisoli TaxID=413434 RepID=A0A1T4JVZ1_9BACT|nr:TonB-dependent receptor [Sediminibacterium ginsengisoli]SJZ34311.1 iron complex outermembrane recepter protein [Sediminibacterium ginsengisoli]